MAKLVFEFTVHVPIDPARPGKRKVVEAVLDASAEDADTDTDVFMELADKTGREVLSRLSAIQATVPDFFKEGTVFDLRVSATRPEVAVSKHMTISDLRIVGPQKRYKGHGSGPDDESTGIWSGEVDATCESEAEYHARMEIARELFWTSKSNPNDDFFDLLEQMMEIDVVVESTDLDQGFEDLLRAAIEAGMEGEVVDRAVELLRQVGREVEIPPSNKP